MSKPVIIVEHSKDSKISGRGSGCSATYISQSTCPSSCVLLGAGCYAERGHVALHQKRVAKASETLSPAEIALMESRAIDRLPAARPLRVHVVGDCPDDDSATFVGSAMARYARRGQRAWTYTHAWRQVKHSSWARAQVVASCHTPAQVRAAHRRGYAAAILVEQHPTRKTYDLDGVKVIPCPAEWRAADGKRQTTCDRCKLCWGLRPNGAVVGFAKDT
jgi:hypothetical protein